MPFWSRKVAPQPLEALDVTVVPVLAPNQLCCFGMLQDVTALLTLSNKEYWRSPLFSQQNEFLCLSASFQDEQISLVLEDGTKLCKISDPILESLNEISRIPQLCFEAFAQRSVCRELLEREDRWGDEITVHINIFGRAKRGMQLAEYLNTCDIALQDPLSLHGRYGYCNPQRLPQLFKPDAKHTTNLSEQSEAHNASDNTSNPPDGSPLETDSAVTTSRMYIHYTISEDHSGDQNSVMSTRLAALGAHEKRICLPNASLALLRRQSRFG